MLGMPNADGMKKRELALYTGLRAKAVVGNRQNLRYNQLGCLGVMSDRDCLAHMFYSVTIIDNNSLSSGIMLHLHKIKEVADR